MTSLLTPTDLELHSGVITGAAGPAERAPRTSDDPRAVLESVIGEQLGSGQCMVQFSGGRDSSLVLAVAMEVARRDGLPLPVALILRHPGVPEAEESHWQDLVLKHLGATSEVVTVERGTSDLCGALAVSRLVRHGPSFPPPSGVRAAIVGRAVGGRAVLTGEGGDEILGASRITPFTAHVVRRRRPSKAAMRIMGEELVPRPLRRATLRRQLVADGFLPWLLPVAREVVLEALLDDLMSEPWDWRRACRKHLASRMWTMGFQTVAARAAAEGFRQTPPLTDPRFVSALARRLGPWGPTSRTATMRLLAGDLLPEAVLTRSTKAAFDHAYASDGVRRFAASWDGSGVDTELVDVEELRRVWLAPKIHWASLLPLQIAVQEAVAGGWQPTQDEASTL